MTRKNFDAKTKLAAWKRSGGGCEIHLFHTHPDAADICEGFDLTCDRTAKELDHIKALILGGTSELDNGAYLCREHHAQKTVTDQGYRAKRNKHIVNRDRPHRDQPKQKMQSRPKGSWPKRAFPKRIKGERA